MVKILNITKKKIKKKKKTNKSFRSSSNSIIPPSNLNILNGKFPYLENRLSLEENKNIMSLENNKVNESIIQNKENSLNTSKEKQLKNVNINNWLICCFWFSNKKKNLNKVFFEEGCRIITQRLDILNIFN